MPNKKMSLKQVKSDAFEVHMLLMDVKSCICATLEAKQESGPKTS